MAEKNTLSILETIKKKMHKFDQKAEPSMKASDISDEFEYISPSAKKQNDPQANPPQISDLGLDNSEMSETIDLTMKEKTPEPVKVPDAAQAPMPNMPKFEDDLALGDIPNHGADLPETPATPAKTESHPAHKMDDFNLDDLDLDDESAIAKAPPVAQVTPTAPVAIPPVPAASTPPAPVAAPASVESEDVYFTEDEIEDYEDEIEEYEDEEEEAKEEVAAEEDDLGLTFSEEDPEEINPAPVDKVEDKNLEDDFLFEDKILSQPAAKQEPVKSAPITPEPAKSEPMKPVEPVKAEPAPIAETVTQNDDDFNFADLEEEQGTEMPKLPEALAPKVETPEVKAPETSETKIEVKKETKKDSDLMKDLNEMSLEELEKSLEETVSKKSEAPKSSALSEIDLEFEKEIMGFKPEVTEPAKQAAPVVQAPAPVEKLPPFEMPKSPPSQSPRETPPQQLFMDEDTPDKDDQTPLPLQQLFTTPQANKTTPQQFVSQQVSIPNTPEVKQSNSLAQTSGDIIYDSTIMRTTESIKKLIDAKNIVAGVANLSQNPMLSELAAQLMEPKLEKWLNENLPEVVEKIVREEIKKIIPKE